MHTCPSCRWSRSHGVLSANRKDWRCYQPDVNRLRPAFLAGNPQAAVRCVAERSSAVGQCGTKGRKWEPNEQEKPPTLLDEIWEENNAETGLEVPTDTRRGEPV